jgi:chromosomal replication initiator protein
MIFVDNFFDFFLKPPLSCCMITLVRYALAHRETRMSPTECWKNTLSILETNLEKRNYTDWIQGIPLLQYDKSNDVLYLGVENDFRQAYLEQKYANMIASAAAESFSSPVSVRFLLPTQRPPSASVRDRDDSFPNENIFNPRYTFDNFIEGENRYAVSASRAVAESPGKVYSPLFIYGNPGLGKTHLMNAIGIYILEHFPKKQVLYISSEAFTEEFVMANRQNAMPEFKRRYRSIDVLLIDDIQFISGKEKTIEEVFNIYNFLYSNKKQMVFTSDGPPKDILGVDERLQSRLAAGLLVDVVSPSYETRRAILLKKASLDGIAEDEGLHEAISFISEIAKTDVRELESLFSQVVAFSKFDTVSITKAYAKKVLKNVVSSKRKENPDVSYIKKAIADHFELTVSQIDSEERSRSLAIPRQIAMFLCREMTDTTFPKIAKSFKKDHSTVQHAYNKIKKEVENNEQMKKTVQELMEKIEEEY